MTERDEVMQNASLDTNVSPEADEAAPPRRVQVPTDRDLFGRPVDFIDADVDAVGHWDESRWSAHPPY